MTLLAAYITSDNSNMILASDTKIALSNNTAGISSVEYGQKIFLINKNFYIMVAGDYGNFVEKVLPRIQKEFNPPFEKIKGKNSSYITKRMQDILFQASYDVDIFVFIYDHVDRKIKLYGLCYEDNFMPTRRVEGLHLLGASQQVRDDYTSALKELYKTDDPDETKLEELAKPIAKAYIAIPYNSIGDMVTVIGISQSSAIPFTLAKSDDGENWILDNFNREQFNWTRSVNGKKLFETTQDMNIIQFGNYFK